jgi:20S proteasome subunit beta 4
MEVLLGITGKDFTIICASKAAMRGATILKASDDKTRELNKHNLMAYNGEAGDTSTFGNTPPLALRYISSAIFLLPCREHH